MCTIMEFNYVKIIKSGILYLLIIHSKFTKNEATEKELHRADHEGT